MKWLAADMLIGVRYVVFARQIGRKHGSFLQAHATFASSLAVFSRPFDAGINGATEVVVSTTLYDKILWHKIWVTEEERKKTKSAKALSTGVLASRCIKAHKDVGTPLVVPRISSQERQYYMLPMVRRYLVVVTDANIVFFFIHDHTRLTKTCLSAFPPSMLCALALCCRGTLTSRACRR